MEIRGHQYPAVQGVATITNSSDEVIPGIVGKTLYLNYIIISIPDDGYAFAQLTDSDGGTVFWKIERRYAGAQPTSFMLNYGDYGSALTEGNGLWGSTSSANLKIIVTALGYYK
tara:strand:- start:56 stop:397 length:342 start_codon:yes stop_codon:yes gene_type:complete